MPRSLRRPRVLAMLLGSLGLASLLVWSIMISVLPRTAYADENPTLVATELESILIRAGLAPEELAALGLSSGTAGQVTTAAAEGAVDSIATIRTADAAFAAADVEYHRLHHLAMTDASQAEALATAQATLTTATTARNNAITAVQNAGTALLSSEQQGLLATLNANRSFGTGTALSAVNRTPAQWVALRDALSHERIQNKRGLAVDETAASLLTSARGASAVVAAQAGLTTNLAAVRAAWDTAIDAALDG